jgi:transposase
MANIETTNRAAIVIVGVDTHKSTHVAVAINDQGARLAAVSIPANPKGYRELEVWSRSLGHVQAFGIEGTGSYGAGLSRSLLAQGHKVIEVTRPNRQVRYRHGKSDSLDAEGAARSVLSGQAIAEPKTQTGSVEMIRHLKIVRDTAVKSRSQAMVTLKTLIINAPAELRDGLNPIKGKIALIRHIAAFRPGPINSTTASAKTAMRALARRWFTLNKEIIEFDKNLKTLIEAKAPSLLKAHGIATMTIAEMLILIGDNPKRIRSEAALAKLCGVCPIPASSGKTNRYRLNRGGNRQANAALYRVAIVRMRNHEPTLAYVHKRTKDGKSKSEIIRCLKRYIVREIYNHICRSEKPPITC